MLALIGLAIWNFVVGVWIMGWICVAVSVLLIFVGLERMAHDDW